MQKKVAEFLKKYEIKNANVLVGYSSGIDSTVLLHVINSLKDEFSLNVTAIHLNHNWRGVESDSDCAFCEKFCKSRGIDFYFEKLPQDIKKNETTARDMRYDFYARAAEKFNSSHVLLAHNKNDNIETAIYRIIKGTGIEGLRAIAPHRDVFYRPLLDIARFEIEAYARCNNLKFHNDSSNSDTKYRRNFIRHELLPKFEEINKTYENSISNLIKVAIYENEIVCDTIEKITNDIKCGEKFDSSEFAKLKKSYQIKILQNFTKNDLKNPNLKKIEQMRNFILDTFNEAQDPQFRRHKKFSINCELFLYANKKEFFKGK